MTNQSTIPHPKRYVPLDMIEDVIKLARARKIAGQELDAEGVKIALSKQGFTFDDFYWSVLRALESETLSWIDVSVLQVDIEPYGYPILEAFRRKVETHGLDILIPHYTDLIKRN